MTPCPWSRRWLKAAVLGAALAAVPVEARPGPESPAGAANVYPSTTLVDDTDGNGNGLIEPNECIALAIQLVNFDPTPATGISATIAAVTPGVSVVTATANYPDIPGFGTAFNVTSFRISTAPTFTASSIELTVTITVAQGSPPPRPHTVPAGHPFQSTGTAAIPDNNPTGAFLPLNVAGLAGALTQVEVTVHVTHPVGNQLDIRLESPGGTSIDLSSDNGLGANYGTSCSAPTTFSDNPSGTPVTLGVSPFTGTYIPEQPLSTFAGVSGANLNGQWRLRVADDTAGGTGTIQCVTLRIQTSAGGPSICRTLTIGDRSVVEGNQGLTTVLFPVTMNVASASLVNCGFLTADYTATAPSDYTAVSGGLTFQPGEVSKTIAVNVVGDLTDELDEIFVAFLVKGSGAYVADGTALATIHDDDGAGSADRVGAVSHGYEIYTHLAAWNPAEADTDAYSLWEDPYSSYEVVVDAVSGDVQPLSLQLLTAGTVTVNSVPVGTGPARSLRWMYDTSTVPLQPVVARVGSGGCGLNCGADDTYRLRVYETTASVPRFNNANGQVSVLLLQAPDYPVQASVLFWSQSGTLLHREPRSLAARSTLLLSTTTIPALQGASGSVTVVHNARYGDLVGKMVTIDAASGFSFDTPMGQRSP